MVGDGGNPNLQTREIGRYMVPRWAVLYSSVLKYFLSLLVSLDQPKPSTKSAARQCHSDVDTSVSRLKWVFASTQSFNL